MRAALAAAAEPLGQKMLENPGGNNIGEAWQREGWDLYDRIPEVRTAARITGQAMSQCRLVIARVGANGEPTPLDLGTPEKPGPDAGHPGPKLLAKFAGGAGGQAALLDLLGVYFTVSGESIVVGKTNPLDADPLDDFDRLQAYSPEQVSHNGKVITVKVDETTSRDREVLTDQGYEAIRIYRPHPRWTYKADSAVKAALTVLREIAMYDDRIQATGQSRLAGRGIMFVNEDLTLPVSQAEDEPGEDASEIDPFMIFLMEVMSLAMADPQSAAAMVPILIRVPDVEKAAKLLDFTTPFDEGIEAKREAALRRFGVAVDMPPEILSGYGTLQSWTGALISEDWKNGYLSGLMGFTTAALTTGWYFKALAAAGFGDIPADTIVWFDDSSVRTKENTGPEAQAAYDRGEINGIAYRRALGYNDGDKPTPEEFLEQAAHAIILKGGSLAPLMLAKLQVGFSDEEITMAEKIQTTLGAPPGGVTGGSAGDGLSGVPPEPGAAGTPVGGSEPGGVPTAASLEALMLHGRRH